MTSRIRGAILIAVDLVSWVIATVFATFLRYDVPVRGFEPLPARAMLALGLGLALLQVLTGLFLHAYSGRNRLGGYADFVTVCVSSLIPALVGFIWLSLISSRPIAVSISLIALPGALVLMLVGRGVLRGIRDWRAKGGPAPDQAKRVVVFGAGEASEQLMGSMDRSHHSCYLLVALLDDDPAKGRRRIDGVHVRGTRHEVAPVAHEYDADARLIAVPSADASLMSELDLAGRAAGLKVHTLPTVAQLVDGNVTSNQIREVNETDVLGRHPVEIDMDEVSRFVAGKIVLVTGAGGSIGWEL